MIGVLHVLLPHASEGTLLLLHELVRKCAHLTEYFILGALLFRAIRIPEKKWEWRWAFLALLIAAFYASSDEMHQMFVPSRGASAWDALLDTTGATIAQIAIWAMARRDQAGPG